MQIPFIPNSSDGTHCFQASIAMMLGFFRPDLKLSFDELDKISAKVKNKWTWPTAMMLWLVKEGFELKLIEDFDYNDFAARGKDYILDRCGKEVGESQIAHSNIDQELDYAREFAKLDLVENRLPDFDDIRSLIKDGYIVMCNINSAALNNCEGYSGHFIVICDCDENIITIHDPGLPARPSHKVVLKQFYKAWAYPSDREKNILAS